MRKQEGAYNCSSSLLRSPEETPSIHGQSYHPSLAHCTFPMIPNIVFVVAAADISIMHVQNDLLLLNSHHTL